MDSIGNEEEEEEYKMIDDIGSKHTNIFLAAKSLWTIDSFAK